MTFTWDIILGIVCIGGSLFYHFGIVATRFSKMESRVEDTYTKVEVENKLKEDRHDAASRFVHTDNFAYVVKQLDEMRSDIKKLLERDH